MASERQTYLIEDMQIIKQLSKQQWHCQNT